MLMVSRLSRILQILEHDVDRDAHNDDQPTIVNWPACLAARSSNEFLAPDATLFANLSNKLTHLSE